MVSRKQGCHPVSMKEGEIAEAESRKHGGRDAAEQGFFGSRYFSGTDVLGNKGGHGLHVGGRDQHDEDAEFFGYTNTGGSDDTHAVYDGDDHEERDADQEILESDGTSEFQNFDDDRMVKVDVGAPHGKRERSFPYEHDGEKHADRLSEDRGGCGSGGSPVELGDEQEIPRDVDRAGDSHREERHFRVTDPAEYAAEDVVGDNEGGARGADPDVGGGLGERLLRSLHDSGECSGTESHENREDHCNYREHDNAAADDGARLMGPFFADLLADKDGDAHGDSCDHRCDALHDLAAGGDSGYRGGRRELSHHEKIHRSVHGLQEQRQKYREGEAEKLWENAAFREIICLFHIISSRNSLLYKKAG